MIGELTNHVWQSTLFAAAPGLLAVACRKNRAHVRYWLWLSASLKFLVPFALIMSFGSHLAWAPAVQKFVPATASLTMTQFTQPFSDTLSFVAAAPRSANWTLIAILSVWACGLACVALVRFWAWRRIRAALRVCAPIDIPAPVPVRSSPGLLGPGVVGCIRPILLLPAGIVEHLTPPQLEAVLAHELCHIRRRDNLFAAIHMMVEAAFWFHPLVWWIGARLVEERERACDEAVLRLGSEPGVYAEAILNVCKLYVESPLVCVSGVTGANLKRRIAAILANRTGHALNRAKKLLLASAGAAALAVPVVIGVGHAPAAPVQTVTPQPPAGGRLTEKPLAFDAVSIKPATDSVGGGRGSAGSPRLRFSPGRVVGPSVTARRIILEAYHLTPYQLSGGPSWLDSDRFYLEAKAETSVDESQIRLMLRTLLSERFKLVAHRGAREMPVYALTVGKNGLRILEPKNGSAPLPVPVVGVLPVSTGGGFVQAGGCVGGMASRGTVQHFAEMLSEMQESVHRPVIDKTGIQGVYQFSICITSPENLVADVEAQTGLKFESQKAPLDALVIDRIEKPEAN